MNDLLKDFLDVKAVEFGVALNTLKAYRNDIYQYAKMIKPLLPQNVTTEDIESYLKHLNETNCQPKTLARKISCIREFYKFLQSEKIITENPASRIRIPKIGKSLPFFLTEKEINKICNSKQGKRKEKEKDLSLLRMRVMIKLMYSSGLRVSEVVSLPENAINYDQNKY